MDQIQNLFKRRKKNNSSEFCVSRDFSSSSNRYEAYALFSLLLIQLGFYFYYLVEVPLHYDEWHSLRFFSGSSFWTIISFYPSPNNHVFYNLISRVFLLSGIDSEIAVRLPSLFASLVTSYYFFKLCRHFFRPLLSFVILAYVVTLYTFILYSFMARGYSFLNVCCVAMLYASLKLSADYSVKKYRLIFILAQVLGLYTVPSFLYALVPVYVVLGIYIVIQKRSKYILMFVMDCLLSFLLVAGAYSFIVLNNDLGNLLNPTNGNGAFSLRDPDAFEKITFYVDTMYYELFGLTKLKVIQILFAIMLIYYCIKEKPILYFGLFVSVFMFFSPYLIIVLHQVFPFGRNWLYLIFPSTLAFGFLLHAIGTSVKTAYITKTMHKIRPVFYLFIISWSIFQMFAFGGRHRNGSAWDYELDFLRNTKLTQAAKYVRTIGHTDTGQEFYPAEVIRFVIEKDNPGEAICSGSVREDTEPDLLIINGEVLDKYRKKLLHYNFMYAYNNTWIYIKKIIILK